MIRGLTRGYPGLTTICENCQSLVAYSPSDIQKIAAIAAKGIVCPICHTYIKTDLVEDEPND